jgi:hypothetical protein
MWMIWALVIFGGVWDAAYSAQLRNVMANICISVEEHTDETKLELFRRCREGSAGQIWLWEGKKLKNKLTGKCIKVDANDRFGHSTCSPTFPAHYKEKMIQSFIERLEFTRFGEHGLKNCKEKCLKYSGSGMRVLSNCTEDNEDPYYE